MLYKFEIPIDDYYGEKVFFKELYFEGDRCPSYNEMIAFLEIKVEKEQEEAKETQLRSENILHFTFTFSQCLNVIKENGKNFPFIAGDLVYTNNHCETKKWGIQSISCKLITPFKIS